eukprot:3487764-Ditylum_brightwellii.AAC.1
MQRHLHAQVQAKFDLCITKMFPAVNVNTKKAAKHSLSSSILLFDFHKHNQDDQEKLPGSPFESS